jgi:hypothetical protein
MEIYGFLPATDGSVDFDTNKGMFRLCTNGEVLRFDTYTESFHQVCPEDYAVEVDAITVKAAQTS